MSGEPKDLLIEIGTEELPPKSLKRLASALLDEVCELLAERELGFTGRCWYATPRRLAIKIERLDNRQADRKVQRRGPALDAAFDDRGAPTRATEGFAAACGVNPDALKTLETDKGSWLIHDAIIKGVETQTLIPGILETALKRLPIAKRMRWGQHDFDFVRPVKWLLILFGNDPVNCALMGIHSGSYSFGHRFHSPAAIKIENAGAYLDRLRAANVIADYTERQSIITAQANSIAEKNNGAVLIDPGLLDEVTALVEWPVCFSGNFDPEFLKLPEAVLIATLQDHQRYFPVMNHNGELSPCFIGVANIDGKNPETIKRGNERVIQPRLNDAAFFLERDIKHGLQNHIDSLAQVVYQKQLGTLNDKSRRITALATLLAETLKTDVHKAKRAAELCLCDLLTEMVAEFPRLQGTMGRYYATAAGEDAEVAEALAEYYLPRFAGDALPATSTGQCLAICEKIDTLVGIFAIGKAPTGDKDPFGLRRSAIGLLRIIIECELDIALMPLLAAAADNYPRTVRARRPIDDLYRFLMERLRRYYMHNGASPDSFESVLAIKTDKPLDFHHRLNAVTEFRQLPEAKSLAVANKRINNILKKSGGAPNKTINEKLLSENAEILLASSLKTYQQKLAPLLQRQDYKTALTELAGLRNDVDGFFDNVLVMCDDPELKNNRLALLNSLNALFLETADIAKLQG